MTIRVPKIDRSSTDLPRLVTKIVKCKGSNDKTYRLQCKHVFMQGWYRTGDLMPYDQDYDVSLSTKSISLREAFRIENPSKLERKKCRCQGPCLKNCFLCQKQDEVLFSLPSVENMPQR